MTTLGDLKKKYPDRPSMKFDPKPDCKYCHGTGERKTTNKDYPITVCICVYVDHGVCEEMQDALNKVAREETKKIEQGKSEIVESSMNALRVLIRHRRKL